MIKAAKEMIFGTAITVKSNHPDWSNHSCIEEAIHLCDGRTSMIRVEPLLKEFEQYTNELNKKP